MPSTVMTTGFSVLEASNRGRADETDPNLALLSETFPKAGRLLVT